MCDREVLGWSGMVGYNGSNFVDKLILRCESCVIPSHNVRWGQSQCLEREREEGHVVLNPNKG
jgi:hypothetical protein